MPVDCRRWVISLGAAGLLVSPTPAASQATRRPSSYTESDVAFLRGMIVHHRQAITMAALVPTHAQTPALKLLARRIDVSQHDEIKLMTRWLEDRQLTTELPMGSDKMASMPMMPGMLSPEEMTALEAARGPEFDRKFLVDMIKHHEGALQMVKELFGTEGGGQNVDIFRFASEIDADQRAEIKRMQALLTPKRD